MFSKLHYIIDILKAPWLTIDMGGSQPARKYYEVCNKTHPTLKLIRNKRYLVALMAKDQYQRQDYDIHKAEKRGYYLSQFLPGQYLDDILDIYYSVPVRQGKFMSAFNRVGWSRVGICMGVFRMGKLVAFANPLKMGNMTVLSSIMGHSEYLKDGVMFLLMDGIMRTLTTKWLMYDTFLGNSEGLKYFKMKFGFRAFNVRWCIHN